MSNLIKQLLTDQKYSKVIQQKLPPAFQTVEDELKGNPAVGLLREQVILGMLIAFLGKEKVEVVPSGVNPDIDCYIDSEPISIKTVSSSGGIRLKWTSNASKAQEFIGGFEPNGHLFIVRIIWGDTGTIRFISLDTQKSIFHQLGAAGYLDYRGSTNTRGVNLSQGAELALNQHPQSISLPIRWNRSEEIINPVDKWVSYWQE